MTTLYTATVDLGLGLSATIEIYALPARPAPVAGSEWPIDADYPGCSLQISLPQEDDEDHYDIAPELQCPIELLDEQLTPKWGKDLGCTRHRTATARGPRQSELVTQLRERAERELAPLIAHVAARAARLAQRERTIAMAVAS